MARKGIEQNDVAKAIDALRKAGLTEPSVRMIHQKLGQGSLSTIVKHKRAIEAQQRAADPAMLPDTVQEKISEAVQSLWAELAEAADGIVTANEQQTEKTLAKYQDASLRAEARADESSDQAAAAQQQLKETLNQVKKLEKDLDKQITANQQLIDTQRSLKSESALIEREKALQTKRIEQLETDIVSSTKRFDDLVKQHRTDRTQWEKSRRDLQKAHDTQTTAVSTLQGTIKSLTTQVTSLEAISADYKQGRDRLAADNKTLNRDLNKLAKSNGALESSLSSMEAKLKTQEKQWRKKFDVQKKEIEKLGRLVPKKKASRR